MRTPRVRRSIVLLVPVLALAVAAAGAVAPSTRSADDPTERELLRIARGAAKWLDRLARPDPFTGAMSWPRSATNDWTPWPGLDWGAAGVGTFYLRLWEATGRGQDLEVARTAGRAVAAAYERGQFGGPDWLAGAASGGTFALKLYRATGEQEWLDLAELAADYLMSSAIEQGGGYHWTHGPGVSNRYVGLPHGAAGIGLFLAEYHEASGDPDALEHALGAYRWADLYSLPLGADAKGWKRLTIDTEVYHLWSGSTGMIFFQDVLARVTGDRHYLREMEKTARGLVDGARRQPAGIAWPYTPSSGSLPTPYFHGAASTIESLLLAWETLGDRAYLRAARRGAQWLASLKSASVGGGGYWPHIRGWAQYDTGLGVGTASVGRTFVLLNRARRKALYRDTALDAARYLIDLAETPGPGQKNWINYTNPEDLTYAPHEYSTGWSDGAPGIAIFLLDVREMLREESAARRGARR